MYRGSLFAILLAAAAAAVSGFVTIPAAVAAAPTPVPVTRPDFSSMRFMSGTWTCTSIVRGKNRPDTSTTTIGLDGAYMISHDVAPPFDRYRTQAVRTDTYMTYNPRTHQWLSFNMDNFGGYLVTTSPGWNGNTMINTTLYSQDGTTGTATTTKLSDTQTRTAIVTKDKGMTSRQVANCKKS